MRNPPCPPLPIKSVRRTKSSTPTSARSSPGTSIPIPARRSGWRSAKTYKFNPLKDVQGFDDLKLFGFFEDEWLRGGPVRRWVPKAIGRQADLRLRDGRHHRHPQEPGRRQDDFRIDYEMFSDTLPDKYFPKGANWLMLGPSGPRRLRLAVEHLCQYRGGICFCVDLDPRWVVKLIKKGWMEHLKAYQEHVIDQAMTVLSASHDIKCMFTTPKLLDALATRLEKEGSSIARGGHHRHLLRRHRDDLAMDSLRHRGVPRSERLHRADLRQHADGPGRGRDADGGARITRSPTTPRSRAPSCRWSISTTTTRWCDYGQTGRVMLTTLTKEFFVPRFMERDEGEREAPSAKYPWDGVSGVRPFREFAATTTVGVY